MAEKTHAKGTYIEAVGRRKTAIARVRIYPEDTKTFTVNDADINSYFPTNETQKIALEAFNAVEMSEPYAVTVLTYGGGTHAQAEAVRLGIARALVKHDPELRTTLKKAGFLKRDPRMTERKKFGLRGARRRPQWSKR